MSSLTSLSLTNVRCFAGTQQAELPRITVLVGENSAGKSTFLGCARTLAQVANLQKWDRERSSWGALDDENHFALQPFWMGSFETIARSGAETFSLEATLQGHCYDWVRVMYDKGDNGAPRERKFGLRFATDRGDGPRFEILRLDQSTDRDEEMWRVVGPDFEFDFAQSSVSHGQFSTWLSHFVWWRQLPYDGNSKLRQQLTGDLTPEADRMFARFVNFFRQHVTLPTREQALIVASNDPVGWRRKRAFESNPFRWKVDADTLEKIRDLGRELTIFNDVEVRRGALGQHEVWADASNESYNLVDVGFGIQSALPLLHTIASAPEEATLLLLLDLGDPPGSSRKPTCTHKLKRHWFDRSPRVAVGF